MGEKYEIRLTERQLKLVNQALEMFFRMQMGQFRDYADLMAFKNFDYKRKGPEWDKEFDQRIQCRDEFQDALEESYRRVFRAKGYDETSPFCRNTEDMECAIDIWEAIRYKLWQDLPEPKSHWRVDSNPPFHWYKEEPLAEVRKVTDE